MSTATYHLRPVSEILPSPSPTAATTTPPGDSPHYKQTRTSPAFHTCLRPMSPSNLRGISTLFLSLFYVICQYASYVPPHSPSFPSPLRPSRHASVLPVMLPFFPSLLRHRHLFVLLTVRYRLSSSLRLPSFVYSFVTDLFRPFYVPSIISRFCGCTILL